MERKVIYRDRQEFQAADIANVEEFTDESLQHVITDALTGERQITGLQVTEKSATEIEIAVGRLWVGDTGKVYRLDAAQTVSVFSHIPLADRKYLAVSVYGQETETDIQPRDFLIDLQTGQTEPRAVAMEKKREVVTQLTAGLESSEPQKPAAPTGYTIIAYVLLDASGIVEIELAENKRLMKLFDVNARLITVEGWKEQAQPAITTLTVDMAALAEKVQSFANRKKINEMAADVARVKELMNLPDEFSSYGADHFLDGSKTNDEDAEYYARIDEGIRFPWAAQDEGQPALFNPYDSGVKQYSGFIIPDFTDDKRISTTGYAGDLSISQYQYQTFTLKLGTMSRSVIKYGPTREVCTNSQWWQTGAYDPINNIFVRDGETYTVLDDPATHHFVRVKAFWKDLIDTPYWYSVHTDQSLNGSQIAQTFLNAQNSWLTKLGLYFTQKDANGVVYLNICETAYGMPDLSKCIASTSVNAADLKLYTEETVFTFPKPVYLQAGKRYALVITTAGNHKIAVVSGQQYTQGTLFYSMDGEYYQGDFTKDLMMNFYYAKFKSSFVQVQLQPLSLSGGIADMEIKMGAIVPEACDMFFEYQIDGAWKKISAENPDTLTGLPAMLPFRVTFVGANDVIPALNLADSIVGVSRPATTLKHFSIERSLAETSGHMDVQILLEGWDATKHTATIKIRSGATTYTADSVTDEVINSSSIRRTAVFTPDPEISAYEIIVEATTTTALVCCHVAERIDIVY